VIDDLPGSSGRLDVLIRSVRAALLTSHGVRKDADIFLIVGRGERAPRTIRINGETAKFLRPDERSTAILIQKTLANRADDDVEGFAELRHGIAIAHGDLTALLPSFQGRPLCVLSETAPDVRSVALPPDTVIVLGDHEGFDDSTLDLLRARGAIFVSLGPTSLHTEDAVTVMNNELDRRAL
jgi:tRNA (pseudouridine54-N1)-methyltransferase